MSVATERPAAAAAPPPPGGRPAPRPSRAGWLALAGIVAVAFAMLLYLGRTTSFFYDEWDWVLGRREWDLDALLAPHNEHLSLAPVLVFKALFSTVGTDSYVPYRVAGLVVHCGVAVLLFAYARRRVGDLLALGAAATILFLGTAWQDVLWPFQMGYLGSLAAGIGALLALDREDRRGDVTAAVLLAVALASSSLGIPLLLALAVEVLGRPDRRARWWIVVAPALLYAAWYIGYGSGSSTATNDNLFGAPEYVAEAAAGAAGARVRARARMGPHARAGDARRAAVDPAPSRPRVVAAARADRRAARVLVPDRARPRPSRGARRAALPVSRRRLPAARRGRGRRGRAPRRAARWRWPP